MKYYLIRNPDGDTSVTEYTREELIEELGEEWNPDGAMSSLESTDTAHWGEDRFLIIKGEIVTPLKREVVTKIDLP